jgi:hypothetical protein
MRQLLGVAVLVQLGHRGILIERLRNGTEGTSAAKEGIAQWVSKRTTHHAHKLQQTQRFTPNTPRRYRKLH